MSKTAEKLAKADLMVGRLEAQFNDLQRRLNAAYQVREKLRAEYAKELEGVEGEEPSAELETETPE